MIAAMNVTLVVILWEGTTGQPHHRDVIGEVVFVHRTGVGGHQRPFLLCIALHEEKNRHSEVVADG